MMNARISFHIRMACFISRRFQDFSGRWRLIDWLYRKRKLIEQFPPAAISIKSGLRLWADPSDLDGLRYYINGINPREPITGLMRQILVAGDCMLDIGANVGYFTATAAFLCGRETGDVFAFEALPGTFSKLEWVTKGVYKNIHLTNAAVCDKEGTLDFYPGPLGHSGVASLRPQHNAGPLNVVRVKSLTIDSLMGEIPTVKLAKIDVEGAEYSTLRGMVNLLKRDNPFLIIEVTDKWLKEMGSSAAQLIGFLKNLGYFGYYFTPSLRPIGDSVSESQVDILFVHPRRYRELPSQLGIDLAAG
jgi:FkbM family methyltransferase